MTARCFYDGQRFKGLTLPGEGEPGWLLGEQGCTGIECSIEGGERMGWPWFLIYINDEPKYKISSLHVVGVEYLDS
jgi:hypothetical protein